MQDSYFPHFIFRYSVTLTTFQTAKFFTVSLNILSFLSSQMLLR